jgi:7,8-dihydro-6-hydroxymethylpterin-pyrophosphokinase
MKQQKLCSIWHSIFDNRCFVTHEKFKERGFVIHHLWYIENDVRRENYPKGDKGRQSIHD